jgi:cell shape-determining protein MreD
VRRRGGLFSVTLFFAGWGAHALLCYLWGTSAPSPSVPLLAVLAAGAQGRVNAAQSLGFLWGLMLDVQGVTLFGGQGWALALAGFGVGKLSRQIDGEKLSAQVLLGAAGTLFHLALLSQIELVFRREAPHVPGLGAALLQVLMNAAAAPAVFKGVRLLAGRAPSEEGHVFHG